MGTQENQSEIAKFLQQWDEEIEAMQRGLNGLAMTAQHAFISQRIKVLGDKHERYLETLVAKLETQNPSSPDTPA